MAQINQAVADYLWKALTITVEHFHPHIQIHPKHRFLGYARVRIAANPQILPGLDFTLAGMEIKLLRNGELPHVDWAKEKGSNGNFYDHYQARSAELRAVITHAVFQNQEILAAVTQSQVLYEQAQRDAVRQTVGQVQDNPIGINPLGPPPAYGVPAAQVPAQQAPALPNPMEAAAGFSGQDVPTGMPDFSDEIPGL